MGPVQKSRARRALPIGLYSMGDTIKTPQKFDLPLYEKSNRVNQLVHVTLMDGYRELCDVLNWREIFLEDFETHPS